LSLANRLRLLVILAITAALLVAGLMYGRRNITACAAAPPSAC